MQAQEDTCNAWWNSLSETNELVSEEENVASRPKKKQATRGGVTRSRLSVMKESVRQKDHQL